MNDIAIKNAQRFLGFADTYDNARPQMPLYPINVIKNYLGKMPDLVVDLGCGTGLSTLVWQNKCNKIIGIEPSEDMINVARTKQICGVEFFKAYSHETGLSDSIADVVMCSQSFHWMEPKQTLSEVNRILAPNGIFATIDCDWPPISHWEVEWLYEELFNKVCFIENQNKELQDNHFKWDKNKHLLNIKSCGYFRYTREIVFTNSEKCTANRLVNIALSQGGLQSILRKIPEAITPEIDSYKEKVFQIFGKREFNIEFCYRMRIGVK